MPIDNVLDITPRVQYVAAVSQTAFAYPFPIFEDADLVVIVDGVTKTLTTDYTVSGEGDDTGGTVTFLSGQTAGAIVTIYRDIAIQRTSDFQTNGPLSSATFNDELDRLTLVEQQLEALAKRAIRLPFDAEVDDADLELDVDSFGGKYITLDADGKPVPAVLSSTAVTQEMLSEIGILSTGVKYDITDAETAVGVTPASLSIPSNILGVVLQVRYSTYANAAAVADQAGIPLLGTGAGNISTNVVLGRSALVANTTGSQNVAIGKSALEANTDGDNNCAVGMNSLKANTTGDQNSAYGTFSLAANTTGSFNAAFGQNVLTANTTGNRNSAFGQGPLFNNTTGVENSAFGHHALLTNITGNKNSAFGVQALELATGSFNCAFGHAAASKISTGVSISAFGFEALKNATTSDNQTAVGQGALNVSNASGNTAVGAGAAALTTAANITAIGDQALAANVSGSNCTAVGRFAAIQSTATGNVCVGDSSLYGTTSGSANTAVGSAALLTNVTGANNTTIGYQADHNGAAYSNSTTIGHTAISTASNQVTLGNASISTLRCQVTSITALSDARFKKNISPLDIPDAFIDEVEIVTFDWIASEMDQRKQVGVIAQQLDALQTKYGLEWLGLVDKTNPDRWEATPGKLLFPLILKTQRLARRVSALEGDDQWVPA